MAINKFMKAALKALSYGDLDYKIERDIKNLASKNPMIGLHIDIERIVTRGERKIPVAIYYPVKATSNEVILFFHGGGWVTGNVDSYAATCDLLGEQTGRRVVSVDYALAPEFPFPHAVEDCYAVAKELILGDSFFEAKPSDIILAGDSAGGNIAAAVSLMARDRGEFKINRQILIYPAVNNDHSENSEFESVRTNGTDYLLTSKKICDYLDMYESDKMDRYNPYFAPYIAKDLSDQPDTLIITAEFDPLRDEGEAYGEKLKQFGNYAEIHRIGDALHGFFSLPFRYSHVRQAYKYINGFLDRKTEDTPICLNRRTTHEMKLQASPFEKIKSGEKNIELRLFDEKRQKIKIGDNIIFTNTVNGEKICTTVKNLYKFDSFEELYKAIPLLQCGYTVENVCTAHPSDMEKYYSTEEQKKYGVVGIELFPPKQITEERSCSDGR